MHIFSALSLKLQLNQVLRLTSGPVPFHLSQACLQLWPLQLSEVLHNMPMRHVQQQHQQKSHTIASSKKFIAWRALVLTQSSKDLRLPVSEPRSYMHCPDTHFLKLGLPNKTPTCATWHNAASDFLNTGESMTRRKETILILHSLIAVNKASVRFTRLLVSANTSTELIFQLLIL